MALRVGILSAAWGAFAHLPAWRAIDGVEVTAICTSRRETAEAAAQRCGIDRPLWDAMAMCRDPAIDIVDLGTRPGVRLPMVIEALKHGKHVYNSCPHAPDWVGAKAIDAAWDRSVSHTAVDAFSRYLPAHLQMQRMIADGFLGQVLGGTCRFNMSLFNRPDKRFPYNWFADGDRIRPANPDYANLIIRFASGVTVSFQTSWSQSAQEGWTVDLFGTDGRLRSSAPSFQPWPTARWKRARPARVMAAACTRWRWNIPPIRA